MLIGLRRNRQRNKDGNSTNESNPPVDKIERLFRDMPIGVLVLSYQYPRELSLEYINREAKFLFDIDGADVSAIHLGDLFFGEQETLLTHNLLKVATSRHRFETDEEFYKNDSRDRYLYHLLAYSVSDNRIVVTIKDITAHKRLEEELRESKERLRALTEASFEGIIVHINGTILFANPAFGAMFGYKNSEIVGTHVTEFFAPESRDLLLDAIRDQLEYSYKARGIRKDDSVFPVEIIGKYCNYKGRLARVAIIRGTAEKDLVEALEAANKELSRLSITDSLTDLYNRRYFEESIVREVERSYRTGLPLSLLMIDIDNFKSINDRYGHQMGDAALIRLAKVMTEGRRLNDIVVRYGGEEFAILLPNTSRAAAAKVAERMRIKIASETVVDKEHRLSNEIFVCIGIASCPENASEPYGLVSAADKALYAAKQHGRNRVELAPNSLDADSDAPMTGHPLLEPAR
jgi:diguanylate cyclase (GGDEF)-like protein/PAS domain S-box-containing protein